MVAEENPFVCRHEVAAVVAAFARSGARIIERKNLGGDEGGIEPVSHQITADSSHNEPGRVERLAAIESDLAKRSRAKQCNPEPNDDDEYALHFAGLADVLDFMNCVAVYLISCRRFSANALLWTIFSSGTAGFFSSFGFSAAFSG